MGTYDVNITLDCPRSTAILAMIAPTSINPKPAQAHFGPASLEFNSTADAK